MSKALTGIENGVKEGGHGAAQEWFLPVSLSDHPNLNYLPENTRIRTLPELSFDKAFNFSVGKIFC